jgi:hypothetical protein
MQEGAGARLEGRKSSGVAVLSCQKDQPGFRSHLPDSQPGIRAGAISQPKVHQHDVGLQFGGAGDRLSDGPSVSDDGHVALVVDQGGEAICDHLMVLDD